MRNSLEHPTARRQISNDSKFDRIMIISGETELVEDLQIALNHEGYQVSVIHDGLRGLLAVNRVVPNLVIISWSPPRLSGSEICSRIRWSRNNVPIILLTQDTDAEERIAGFQAGASDCVSLPFLKEEFLARIRANLARNYNGQDKVSVLQFADLWLNRLTHEVFRGDRSIQLTATEFNLLEYMMDHCYQVLSRSQILENVWGNSFMGTSNIIEAYIHSLRQKLEFTQENRLIQTVRGVGYVLRESTS